MRIIYDSNAIPALAILSCPTSILIGRVSYRDIIPVLILPDDSHCCFIELVSGKISSLNVVGGEGRSERGIVGIFLKYYASARKRLDASPRIPPGMDVLKWYWHSSYYDEYRMRSRTFVFLIIHSSHICNWEERGRDKDT